MILKNLLIGFFNKNHFDSLALVDQKSLLVYE